MGFDLGIEGTLKNSVLKIWSSAGFISEVGKVFLEKYGHSILSWIPVPEDEESQQKVLYMFIVAGAMMILSRQIEKRAEKSPVHLPFHPRRIAINYVIVNTQNRLPLWKKIYYYIFHGYEYHTSASAESLKRLQKNNREQHEELVWNGNRLPYANCRRKSTNSMWRIPTDYTNEEITNEFEAAEPPDDDEMLMLALDIMTSYASAYLLKLGIHRSLGHFSREDKREILRRATREHYPKGHQLFSIGDMDDAMYFIVSGTVQIYFHKSEGSLESGDHPEIKIARKGDHINSFFSFLDAVTGYLKTYKTVEARCREDSIIVKIPYKLFNECWLTDSQKIVSGIRSILMRIFQINYIVFDQILGLRTELFHFVREPTPEDMVVDWDDGEVVEANSNVGTKRRVSKQMRQDAINSLSRYFRLPEEAKNILEDCDVYSVDKCHGVQPLTVGHFYYIYKGVVEMFKIKEGVDDEIDEVNVDFNDCHEADEGLFEHQRHVVWLYSGDTFGGLTLLLGDSNYSRSRLHCKSVLVKIKLETYIEVIKKYPQALYSVVQEFIKRVSKFARSMDFCMEWTRLDSGDTLFTEVDDSDDAYVVLNGLMKSERTDQSGKINELAIFKRRDWIGLVEALAGVPRSNSVVALRETELAKLPSSFIKSIKKNFTVVAPILMNYLAKRLLTKIGTIEMPLTMKKRCSTMSIVHISGLAPTYVFAMDLMKSYCCETGGSAVIVTESDVCRKLSLESFVDTNDVFLCEWLATLEDRHDLIIYMVHNAICPWSYKCCSSSDIIMGVVTSKDLRKELREVEAFYDTWAENAKKELVICHEIIRHPGGTTPFGTRGWLEPRPWLSKHHHVRYPPSAFKLATVSDREFINHFYLPLKEAHDKHSDAARISRWLSGQSTGVVFGSSTLEGIAVYIGALQAMETMDVPIDMICGAGWASLVAALYSIHQDSKRVERKVHWVYQLLTDPILLFFDSVIPYSSRYAGDLLNHCYHGALGDIHIEDLVIPFFVSTSDISSRVTKMHISGSLWRLARASATRIKVHPPMCDPLDGGYIVDGSYCNPVPTNLMRKFGAAFVITVEIGSPGSYNVMESEEDEDRTPPITYAEIPSLFNIRDVLSNIQSTFYQKKLAVKDRFNMTVSVDISTDEEPEDIGHELYVMLLYRGYAEMFCRLKIILSDPVESKEDFWKKMHNPEDSEPPERIEEDSKECHRLLYEEKLRYQRNNVQEIIENFRTSNLQFLRAGQLL